MTRKVRNGHRPPNELIIIGGGPAGLTAAVYAGILKMDAFLITEKLGGQAIDSTKIENYMGHDFISGPELIDKFKHQLIHSHYLDHLLSEVRKIENGAGGFNVTVSDSNEYSAQTLIVATGMTRQTLNVPGEEAFQRRGVFYGNIQDISFVHGEDVAVIGGGNSALQIVENLHTVANNVHLISSSGISADPVLVERARRFPNLHSYEGFNVVEITGDNTISHITVRESVDGEPIRLAVKGVFIAIGLKPNASAVSDLVSLNDKGEIMIHPDCSTSCPGIFAAGDVTDAFGKRIVIASGEGAKAAIAARQYLLSRAKGTS